MAFDSSNETASDLGGHFRLNEETSNEAGKRVKRTLDVVLATSALVFIAPLLLVIALLIRLQDGGPALFVQSRVGRDGKMFSCFKFRSMTINADERLRELIATNPSARMEWEATQKLRNDPRITRLGHFLRKSSLDELPQLLNIIRGEMSIVGPRPIVEAEIAKYGAYFDYYTSSKPGLTGLWQVSGRSNTSYAERVQLDVRYAREWTVMGDIRIIAMTIPAILTSRGAH